MYCRIRPDYSFFFCLNSASTFSMWSAFSGVGSQWKRRRGKTRRSMRFARARRMYPLALSSPAKNLLAALAPLHRGNEHVRVRQFPVHLDIGDRDELEARVADLTDEQFRELLADAIRDALKTNT